MPELYLAGRWIAGATHATIRAPWDQSVVDDVALADEAQIEHAVQSAHERAPVLATLPTHRRRDLLRAISAGIAARREEFAALIAREACKPIALARVETDRAVQTFAIGAEESSRLGGEALALDQAPSSDTFGGFWMRVPAGPVLAISPFNFPLNLVAHKLSPAFALGAPVVLKPAPQAPLTALLLARVIHEAGAPEGLLSVVPTSNALAERMVRDDRFAVLSFTGSARVGWMLKSIAGRKRVLLELGGNAAAIVAADADVDRAAARIIAGGFGYAGQVCIKVQRVFADGAIADRLFDALLARTEKVKVLDPLRDETLCSAMIDEANARRVHQWIAEATNRGARVLTGGSHEGNRYTPTLVLDAPEGTQLVDEELFGPAITLHRFDAIHDAIASINRGRYGLQAGVFTHDLRIVQESYASLQVGAVVINEAPTFRVDSMPYGGVKDSGLGREGVRFAIDEMSEKRMLIVRGLLGAPRAP